MTYDIAAFANHVYSVPWQALMDERMGWMAFAAANNLRSTQGMTRYKVTDPPELISESVQPEFHSNVLVSSIGAFDFLKSHHCSCFRF